MKILLTGAMGFLGSRTLEKLIENESITAVKAASRTNRDWRKLEHPKVQYEYGDLTDPFFVHALVEGCDAIIHTAALSSPWGSYEAFLKANVEVQRQLIRSAKEHGVQRFVYVSTPSMYFELKNKLDIHESHALPKKFINAYAETKRQAEKELEESGIPYVSLRPRALIGRGDTIIMPRLIRAYDEGKLKIMGDGKNIVDLTAVSNVADALILGLFVEGKGVNQIYNISNGEPVALW
ncbi:MAG: NAD(P)-dependent oxidoreductase, partial [Bacteroidetes bacterium]